MLVQPDVPKATPLTPAANAALDTLADVVVPQPTPWTPQTWGWAALALLVFVLVVWVIVRAVRRRRANRYRVEALAELTALESRVADDSERASAVAVLPALLKRVALAAWPRAEVASLSGSAWVRFLRAHAGRSDFPDDAAQLLADGEYQTATLGALSAADAQRIAGHVRRWIEAHRVRP
jgi:flagellar biosynthesis/type III secretory pathway M-ring protein FliF/YscJ